jgi:predicted aspartyl protease
MRDHHLWVLSLLIVVTMAGEPVARANGDKQAVRFDLYRDYLIVARGSASPMKNLNFLLDTGANYTILDRRLTQKLHLHELPSTLTGLNGSVAARQAIVPTLQLGPMRRDNLPVVLGDLSFLDKALPVRIDAVIGLDLIGQGAFEIDYISRQIHFGSIPSWKYSLRLRMEAGLPFVDAELNQNPVHLLLDTGAFSLIIFEPKAPTVSPVKISAIQPAFNTFGEVEGKQVLLHSLRLGQADFRREPALLAHGRVEGIEDFDGIVSPALLGITQVAIDPEQGVVVFSR